MFKHDILSLVLNNLINVSQLSVELSLITNHSFCSMSVTQAMEWLIEHVDDPMVDTPLPGQDTPGAAAAAAAAAAPTPAPAPGLSATVSGARARLSSQASIDEAKQDELTEIFKRIRRKREFRPDSRVSVMWVS